MALSQWESRGACGVCGLYAQGCKYPFSDPYIPKKNWNGLLILEETFNRNEDEAELALFEWLKETHWNYEDTARAGVVRCRPPHDKAPTMGQIKACRAFLLGVVQRLQPKYILAVGGSALKSVYDNGAKSNIGEWRARPLVFKDLKVLKAQVYCTYSSTSVVRGATQFKARIVEDLLRFKWRRVKPPVPGSRIKSDILALDTEADKEKIFTIAVSDGQAIQVSEEPQKFLQKLKINGLIGHNVMFDLDQLMGLRPEIVKEEWLHGKNLYDTLLLARMEDETRGQGNYQLEKLFLSRCKADPWKYKTESYSVSEPSEWPENLRKERCGLDAYATHSLWNDLYPKGTGKADSKFRELYQFTQKAAVIFHFIHLTGMPIDIRKFNAICKELSKNRDQYEIDLGKFAQLYGMPDFSPTKDADLQEILYKRLKFKVVNRTPGGAPAVNLKTLHLLGEHEFLTLLMEFNKNEKLYSSFVESKKGAAVKQLLELDGVRSDRLYPNINPLGARTGRRSSDRPNVQNWTKKMRKIVVSRYPGGKIVELDYGRLEVVLFSWQCKDDRLMEYFTTGEGYIGIGRELWRKDVKEGTEEYRAIKAVVLGIQYGMGAFKLAVTLWDHPNNIHLSADWQTHIKIATQLRQKYLDMFPCIEDFMWKQEQLLLKQGYIVSPIGRIRHLPCPEGRDTPNFGNLRNQAINFPIQSTASEVTASAMIDGYEAVFSKYCLTYKSLYGRLLHGDAPVIPLIINEIHDALLWDMPPKGLKDNVALIESTMKEVPTVRKLIPGFSIPLNVDVKIRDCWGG